MIIVGAGPAGLTLATELRLVGVKPLVLDRLTEIREVAKAGGIGGQILNLLRYRELRDLLDDAAGAPVTAKLPFGGIHVDLTELGESPMQVQRLPQPQLEALLQNHVRGLGVEVRRGHEVTGLQQDDDAVHLEVQGPDGAYRVSAQYVVGCDGVRSRVRELAGVAFPGITYPEIHRLATVSMPPEITVRDDGDYDIPGYGRLAWGYSQTPGGIFAIASSEPGQLGLYTSEPPDREYDDDIPLTLNEFRDSVHRVLGTDIPLGEPRRLTRFTYAARHTERYVAGRVLLAGDAAHQIPTGGVAVSAGMLDGVNLAWKLAATIQGWAPAGLLDTYHSERHLAGDRLLLHAQAQVALRRGHDPANDALRKVFSELVSDAPALARVGAMIAASDVRYPMTGTQPHALAGTFASHVPDDVVAPLRAARPVFVGPPELCDVAAPWRDRVTILNHPAEALLIRPDAHIAWAGATDTGLQEALAHWFGDPR
ncbi:FAD-binding monooxygenase [Mycobacterium sp. CBMA293]|nr:FAD-binding monooxygenase [Mycolicibacterium sp. CBMA 360]MUL57626.1 FAD-binding monooxygenase [Mycolicibacterium sp. CBMA 335]MUL70666.1 FAD-binding monooxygenase [Mycolicibacterium sp. CBMA 311]MUL92714.1 FAD-binding monooxygenase [Mycolicibacterium sp. CBMA 230]MUM08271.1 FAD-binding monooxygenase [Mycolicibacterium sp. CBMA 213]MUM12203.1 FAD-binding monooxygenase [Mycolicibacterium sp. CBMA 293]